ncbi:oxidoreductase [Streptomyces sp.]|uniref:oxidoreductase n=1 Tax=Streptomyces sp. TaxID=1931 RepID=UPI002F93CE06
MTIDANDTTIAGAGADANHREPRGANHVAPTDRAVPAGRAGYWNLGGQLPVARMGFGAMRLAGRGFEGPKGDPARAVAVLRRAVELGVDHIDTAAFYFYEDLAANALIREALHPYPEHLVIATKVGPDRSPDGQWLPPAGPDGLRAAVHRNLRELGRDHLDLVHLRVQLADTAASVAERFGVLAELREQGLIRHLGLSNVHAGQLAEAQEAAPVATVQNWYTASRRGDDELLRSCARQGIAFTPFFPLGGEELLGSPRLAEIAARYGARPAQIALTWLLARSPAVLAIPGTASLAHLEDNVAAAALRLDTEDLAAVDALGGDARP